MNRINREGPMPRILLIDDDDTLRAMAAQMLSRAGHEVVEAPNGREGLRRFSEQPFDLVITDLIMPEQEGLETILQLRQKGVTCPVLAISGGGRQNNVDYLPLARQFGARQTLRTPFTREEFLTAVKQALS